MNIKVLSFVCALLGVSSVASAKVCMLQGVKIAATLNVSYLASCDGRVVALKEPNSPFLETGLTEVLSTLQASEKIKIVSCTRNTDIKNNYGFDCILSD